MGAESIEITKVSKHGVPDLLCVGTPALFFNLILLRFIQDVKKFDSQKEQQLNIFIRVFVIQVRVLPEPNNVV